MQADLHRLRPSKTATPDRNLLNHMAPDIDPSIRNARAGVRIQHRLGQKKAATERFDYPETIVSIVASVSPGRSSAPAGVLAVS